MRVHTVAKLINNNWTNTTVSFALARNSGPEWSQYGVYGGDAGLGSRGRFYRLCPDGPLLQVSGGTQKPLPLPQVSRVFSSCSCPLLLCWRSLSLSLSLSLWRPCYIRTAKTKTKKNHHSILYSITILFCRLLPATILFFSVIILFSLFHHLLRIRIQHVQSRGTLWLQTDWDPFYITTPKSISLPNYC